MNCLCSVTRVSITLSELENTVKDKSNELCNSFPVIFSAEAANTKMSMRQTVIFHIYINAACKTSSTFLGKHV